MSIDKIREWINLRIYKRKSIVLKWLNRISLLVSISALFAIVYYYGVPASPGLRERINAVIIFSFVFYFFRFLIRFFFSFTPFQFLKHNWLEGLFMLFLLTEWLHYQFVGETLIIHTLHNYGFKNAGVISNIILQLYLFIIIVGELFSESDLIPKIRVNPAYIFVSTFVIMIVTGTILLMLPNMSTIPGGLSFLDALFTSTSASCVTGLIVVDTATAFTFKGQLVILFLMKAGGLNIISYGASVSFFSKMGVGVRQHDVRSDFTFQDAVFSPKSYLKKILMVTTAFEIIGTLIIGVLMQQQFPEMPKDKVVFFSIFHAISAFNNAGFSNVTDGYMNQDFQQFYMLHFVTSILIFFGAMGIINFNEFFSRDKLRNRLRFPWKKPAIGPRLEMRTAIILVFTGMAAFMFFEKDGTFAGLNPVESGITGLFQSITLRTAGFSTIDFGSIALPTMIIALIWMFIGGSSSSTAGGIKTSTLAVLYLSARATLTGKKRITAFNRTLPPDIIYRAFSTFFFAIFSILLGVFLLSITEGELIQSRGHGMIDIIFEEVSAFSTVGLSTGITPILSDYGKTILIISMFVGRVGTLTIGFALNKPSKSTLFSYPTERMLIG